MIIFRHFLNRIKNDQLSFSEDDLKHSIISSLAYLLLIIIMHGALMTLFEHFSWVDALWLTLTTLSTTGYGDISATTLEGKISTIILLYFGGIFLAAKIAGDYFEYRANNRQKKINGKWDWNMRDHLLIINTPRQFGEKFFIKFIEQARASGIVDSSIEILTEHFTNGLPSQLAQMSGLAHFTGSALNQQDLSAVNPEKAKYIVILAKDEHDPNSDSRTFDILYRLKESGIHQPLILAECVDDDNRKKFKKMGADIVLRPIRAYPEMLVRGLVAPGSEQIIENLFSAQGEYYLRLDLPITNVAWKEIVSKLIMKNFGTAIAYVEAKTGIIHTNPLSDKIINATGLLIMLNEQHNKPTVDDISLAIKN